MQNNLHSLYVTKNQMLSIFLGENIDHPYSSQPTVAITVPYTEYVKFVEEMEKMSISWFQFPVDKYREALDTQSKNKMLLRLYYRDMSCAIINELRRAVRRGKDGTIICHTFGASSARTEDIHNVDNKLKDYATEADLMEGMRLVNKDLLEFINPNELTTHNYMLYEYAVLLRALAFQKNPYKFNMTTGGN